MSFRSELDELVEEAAKAATDAFVHWTMKDLWTGDSLPNTVREGNYEDGWIVGDFLDGQHITFRSPSTGNVPSPFWATDIPGVSLGDHLHEDLQDKPEEWHQDFVDRLTDSFAKWRSLPEEATIVAATEQILDLAACGAADAAAINAAKASALSLAESVRDAMLAAHPDGGHSSSAAAWDTIGLIASIVPAVVGSRDRARRRDQADRHPPVRRAALGCGGGRGCVAGGRPGRGRRPGRARRAAR